MEPREQMSEPTPQVEKDVTLTGEPATNAGENQNETPQQPVEQAENVAENKPVAENAAETQPVAEPEPQSEPEKETLDEAEPECEEQNQPIADDENQDDIPQADYNAMDKQQLVDTLDELLKNHPIEKLRAPIGAIRAAFATLRNQELEQEKQDFLAKGNEEAAFAPLEDELESQFKQLLADAKQKRAEYTAQQEAIKTENLQKKRAIIQQIEEIIADPDNINRQFPRVQQLQQEFREIGPVPATDDTDIWKQYQLAVEHFYDLLKINKELRDYDFRKNLEIKQQLCAEAEALDDETDILVAFRRLQELHNIWRETGPVAKDLREDIWQRFKNASAVINKKHLAFFEERKAHEKENADAKTALCEQIEEIKTDELKSYAAWEEATKKIIALQELWRKLGFASRKVNAQLFARFRQACDNFFAGKAEFFKRAKEEMAENLAKKIALCEQAEALQDSTEWRKTADALVELQKQWKTIGPVAKKHSDQVWRRFIAACDHFFERKKADSKDSRAAEHENLAAKRQIIAEIVTAVESQADDAAQTVRDLMSRWTTIGHVPYKEKDKLFAEFRQAVDNAFEKLDMRGARAALSRFESSIQGNPERARSERERLVRAYEQKCAELKTFENNMGFLNAKSQSGSSLVKDMERRIERIKEDIATLEQKIKLIDEAEKD